MLGFTGFYKDMRISVVAHGIGIPSASVYCTDLITVYGVRRIIRVGSCGTISAAVKLREVVIAMGASTRLPMLNRIRFNGFDFAAAGRLRVVGAYGKRGQGAGYAGSMSQMFSLRTLFYPPSRERDVGRHGKFEYPWLWKWRWPEFMGSPPNTAPKQVALCTVTDDARSVTGLSVEERQAVWIR